MLAHGWAMNGTDHRQGRTESCSNSQEIPREQPTLDELNLQDSVSGMPVAKSIHFRGCVAFPVGFRNPSAHMALVMSHEIVCILL